MWYEVKKEPGNTIAFINQSRNTIKIFGSDAFDRNIIDEIITIPYGEEYTLVSMSSFQGLTWLAELIVVIVRRIANHPICFRKTICEIHE